MKLKYVLDDRLSLEFDGNVNDLILAVQFLLSASLNYEDYKDVCAYISSTDNISKDRYLRLKKAIKELTE